VRYGGPIVSVHALCKALVARGHEVVVFTTNIDGPGTSAVPLEVPVDIDGVKVWYFSVERPRRLYRSPAMAAALAAQVGRFDVVHLHSIFLWPTLAAARAAMRAHVRYVVAPRGMLEKALIGRKSSFVKTAWLALFERKSLERAAAIHVTSEREATEARAFGYRLPKIVLVPNGVEIDAGTEFDIPSPAIAANINEKPYVLFLGRINWKKGLDRLIRALVYAPDASLIVAGNDEEDYRSELDTLASSLRVSGAIRWVGPVHGADKSALIHNASAVILPSYSENFGNVVLEAMAAGRPVIVTPEVGVADIVAQTGAGLVAEGDPESLGAAIMRVLSSPDQARAMGERAQSAVRENFTWDVVAQRMEAMYLDVIDAIDTPLAARDS
jgi:glycosyltransferase involved in cell wall biosynthesis